MVKMYQIFLAAAFSLLAILLHSTIDSPATGIFAFVSGGSLAILIMAQIYTDYCKARDEIRRSNKEKIIKQKEQMVNK